MSRRIVTFWYKWNPKKIQYEYNHMEDGWITGSYPTPAVPIFSDGYEGQSDWINHTWRYEHRIHPNLIYYIFKAMDRQAKRRMQRIEQNLAEGRDRFNKGEITKAEWSRIKADGKRRLTELRKGK